MLRLWRCCWYGHRSVFKGQINFINKLDYWLTIDASFNWKIRGATPPVLLVTLECICKAISPEESKLNTHQQCPEKRPHFRAARAVVPEVKGKRRKGGEGRGGHLLGKRAWAWDVRTSLWDSMLGWMAWLGVRVGLGTCVMPGWLMGAIEPTTVPAKVWPNATGAAPSTCCPMPLVPEEPTVLLLLMLRAEVVWVLWVAVPTAVKYKAIGHGTEC